MTVNFQTAFAVAPGANTFYFDAAVTLGNVTAHDTTLTLVFVATDHGTVDPPTAANSAGPDEIVSEADESVKAAEHATARLERELAAVRAQAEETTRQLAELLAMTPKQQPASAVASPED